MKKYNWLFAVFFTLLLIVPPIGTAIAQDPTPESYNFDKGTTAYRTAVSGADSNDLTDTGIGSLPTVETGSSRDAAAPTFNITCRFSTAGANATITFVRGVEDGGTWTYQGHQQLVITASSTLTDGTDFLSSTAFFDTGGSPHVKIAVHSISAGDVDIYFTKTVK